ncbi:MAG: DEAD/DEAH box helicase family protein [Candidatus Methanofastidiosa archaeon]|nr:DEAD/DEAH box helicase family protein [Candidatus Methanofastidiosa archaeon]
MRLKITADKKFLQVVDSTALELEQIQYSFTKRVDNWFIIKKKIPHWDGEVKFIDKYNRIPIGLWQEIKKFADKYSFPLEIEEANELFTNRDYNGQDFDDCVEDYFKDAEDFYPRDYQTEASKRVLKYSYCTEEISTSGGKTLIAFMIFKYLLDKGIIKRMIYVVPNINLVTQTEEKFYEYEDRCNKKPNWKSKCVFAAAKKTEEDVNIVFGTFQSLAKKDLSYFQNFDAVCIDETHHARANSIKSIIVKCHNAKYKFGLTGTLPKEGSCDSFMIQSYLGPKVYELLSADLIATGNATPVHVIGIELDYLTTDLKKKLYDLRNVSADLKDGAKLLALEKDTARDDRKRFKYVCETINKSTKNSLVLFSDIKNSYGRNIYDWLRENSDKNVYYIDGGTKADNRDYYKKRMEDEEHVILIASIGTFSEGIDILNVHNIYIVESNKSEYIVRQILGRGMRLMEGKEKIQVIDFSDNFEYGSGFQKKNYLMRHSEERERIYKDKRFPFKRFKVKL